MEDITIPLIVSTPNMLWRASKFMKNACVVGYLQNLAPKYRNWDQIPQPMNIN